MRSVLSILIPTIPSRSAEFIKLSSEVTNQILQMKIIHPTLGNVELLSDSSEPYLNGGPSIGKKRQALVQRARGKYLCFLDDDENISPMYVESLVRLCLHERDIATFRAFVKTDHYWGLVNMSLDNEVNEETGPDRIIKRTPWPCCPVRTRFAQRFDFPDTNYSEDFAWMEQVLKLCSDEAHTDQILMQYNHSKKTSEADKITKYELDKKT